VDTLEPPFGARDAQGMAARLTGIPQQIEAALAADAAEPWQPPVAKPVQLAVGALGGSAIAADLSSGVWADRLPWPIAIVRDVQWPAWVGRGTLAVLCSYSGSTQETLALYDEAGARSAPRVAMTTGGVLAERCARDDVPVARLAPGSPPRAALYGSWVRFDMLLHALGAIDDPRPLWREAAALVTRRLEQWSIDVPESRNPAKQLARRLRGRFLFLYAAERRAALATRVRNQINENAKLLAHSATVPELDHNEVVGWERPGAFARDGAVLMWRDREDSAAVALRLDLTAQYLRDQGAEIVELTEEDGSRLAREVSRVVFGDFLSFYLALVTGADPTPIASIDWLKTRLAESNPA
jgi:glucose/mannose-6-phosphate isomerase